MHSSYQYLIPKNKYKDFAMWISNYLSEPIIKYWMSFIAYIHPRGNEIKEIINRSLQIRDDLDKIFDFAGSITICDSFDLLRRDWIIISIKCGLKNSFDFEVFKKVYSYGLLGEIFKRDASTIHQSIINELNILFNDISFDCLLYILNNGCIHPSYGHYMASAILGSYIHGVGSNYCKYMLRKDVFDLLTSRAVDLIGPKSIVIFLSLNLKDFTYILSKGFDLNKIFEAEGRVCSTFQHMCILMLSFLRRDMTINRINTFTKYIDIMLQYGAKANINYNPSYEHQSFFTVIESYYNSRPLRSDGYIQSFESCVDSYGEFLEKILRLRSD